MAGLVFHQQLHQLFVLLPQDLFQFLYLILGLRQQFFVEGALAFQPFVFFRYLAVVLVIFLEELVQLVEFVLGFLQLFDFPHHLQDRLALPPQFFPQILDCVQVRSLVDRHLGALHCYQDMLVLLLEFGSQGGVFLLEKADELGYLYIFAKLLLLILLHSFYHLFHLFHDP